MGHPYMSIRIRDYVYTCGLERLYICRLLFIYRRISVPVRQRVI